MRHNTKKRPFVPAFIAKMERSEIRVAAFALPDGSRPRISLRSIRATLALARNVLALGPRFRGDERLVRVFDKNIRKATRQNRLSQYCRPRKEFEDFQLSFLRLSTKAGYDLHAILRHPPEWRRKDDI
jgi:hypothetical protein